MGWDGKGELAGGAAREMKAPRFGWVSSPPAPLREQDGASSWRDLTGNRL